MASSVVLKVACLAMMMCLVLGLITHSQAAPTCSQVHVNLSPCLSYLQGNDSKVPGPCCHGIKKVNNEAKTTPDRQSVCNCIKSTTQSIRGLNHDKLAGLPRQCGVNLPYKLTPPFDCNKVK